MIDDDMITRLSKDIFKIDYLFPYQSLVVSNIIDSYEYYQTEPNLEIEETKDFIRNQMVILPTGSGKSLCFQLPSLMLPGPTLVIYPLLALMNDQESSLKENGILTCVLKGGQTPEEREKIFESINNCRIIIANPEILMVEKILTRLKEAHISHIAIDEAHCVYEWGSTFRPNYLELPRILKELRAPVVTAFTATASPEVLFKIKELLFNGRCKVVYGESDRENLIYYVHKVYSKEKAVLYLASMLPKPMIIFCSSRARTREVSFKLNMIYKDISKFYHAGLTREEKKEIEDWFYNSEDGIMVSTCAFGMGTNKKNIRTVIHLDIPDSIENYVQEAGRGGRDKNKAIAVLLYDETDKEKFKNGDARKLKMYEYITTSKCRRQTILDFLKAETTECSGCDICLKKNIYIPNAGQIVYKVIRNNPRYYTKNNIEKEVLPLLNKAYFKGPNVNIWDKRGIKDILRNLEKEGRIKLGPWIWKECLESTEPTLLVKLLRHLKKLLHLLE